MMVTPMRRSEYVLAKVVTTMFFGMVSGLSATCGLLLSGFITVQVLPRILGVPPSSNPVQLEVSLLPTVTLMVCFVGIAFFVAAMLLFVCGNASSFKHAQTSVGPVSMALMLPTLALQILPLERTWTLFSVPLLGGIVALVDTLKNQTNLTNATIATLSTVLVSLALIVVTINRLQRREILAK
jgi:sodium transport system permease protein